MEHIEDRPVFLGALQDVTESKVAEATLRFSEAELRRTNRFLITAQKLSKTGSFIWDVRANERQWSEEMYRILEQDPSTAVPSAIVRELVHPEDWSTFEALTRQASEGQDFNGELRLLMPSGKLKNIHVVGDLLNGSVDGPVFVGAAQDVTELRLREDALNAARAELAHVARVTTLSALTASIAHEVSQPLSGILTNANTCLRMLVATPPNLEGIAETARRSIRDINRATEVIKRLRALFARKARTMEAVDLNEAAREVIALTSSELQRSRVLVQTAFASDLPTVHGDRIQLQQVILNLVMNAAEAMTEVEDQQKNIAVQTQRDRGERVVLSVRDAGMGIEPQDLEKLFDAFYTTKAHGMGVGLSISRSIIESHEGRLWAAANDGPGATFSFSIPCVPGPASGLNRQ
jgi:signal transduction histidine kinase